MPKIFRGSRNEMLTSASYRSYFAYALGEIFLVVVGILIALQINIWNEGRKERIQENSLIESLITDLQADTTALHILIEFNENKLAGLDSLMNLSTIDLELIENRNKFYLYNVQYLLTVGTFRNNKRTWNLLDNTGGLRVIQKDVANRLSIYQQHIITIQKQGEYTENAILDIYDLTSELASIYYILDEAYFKDGQFTNKPMPPINDDAVLKKKYFNMLNFARGTLKNYVSENHLSGHLNRTSDLIQFLQETYGLGE